MDFADRNKPMFAKFMLLMSYLCVMFAAVGFLGADVFLASTQWILVGIMLTAWATFIMVEAHLRHK